MATQLQAELKSAIERAENLAGSGVLEGDKLAEYQGLVKRVEAIKSQIDMADVVSKTREWAQQSDGSVVKSGFSRMASEDEGAIEGVAADGADLYAYNALGEAKLKALKSGAYKKAMDTYIRSVGRGRPVDGAAMKVLEEGNDSAGGFWIPPDFRAELIKKMATMTAIRPNANVITTGTDMVSFPKVVYTTDDKYTAGTRFSWSAENPGSNYTESTNPVSGKTNIPVHLATASIYLTRQMVEDSAFDVMGYVSGILAETFALGEEDAFINGSGAGQPQGILNHANINTASGTTDGMKIVSGSASAIAWGTTTAGSSTAVTKGIIAVEAALPPQYEAGAKWLANKGTYSTARGMVDSNGRPLWNITEAWPTLANGMSPTLLGYPILKSQFMPDIAGDSYPMLFGDFKSYTIADRVGLSIEVFREVLGLQDLVVVYARKRVGGQLVRPWMLKALKCAAS